MLVFITLALIYRKLVNAVSDTTAEGVMADLTSCLLTNIKKKNVLFCHLNTILDFFSLAIGANGGSQIISVHHYRSCPLTLREPWNCEESKLVCEIRGK